MQDQSWLPHLTSHEITILEIKFGIMIEVSYTVGKIITEIFKNLYN